MKDDVVLVLVIPVNGDAVCECGSIKSRGPSRSYDAGWDRIFGGNKDKESAQHTVN